MVKRNYRLLVEYNGTNYAGFQRLGPTVSKPTVQGTLEEVLTKLMDCPIKLNSGGRTDAGVHALGQVVSFSCNVDRSLPRLLAGSNGLLPRDIRVLRAQQVPERFHARFSALSRSYTYVLWSSAQPDCFMRERVTQVGPNLDIARMNQAAQAFLGSHDFSTFGSQVPADASRVRCISELTVTRHPVSGPACFDRLNSVVEIRIRANSFLRRMVRMLSASLVKVGLGQYELEEPGRLLELRNPQFCPPPLSPSGLYLTSIEYAQDWE